MGVASMRVPIPQELLPPRTRDIAPPAVTVYEDENLPLSVRVDRDRFTWRTGQRYVNVFCQNKSGQTFVLAKEASAVSNLGRECYACLL